MELYTQKALVKRLGRSVKWLKKWVDYIPSPSYEDKFGRKFFTDEDYEKIKLFSLEKKFRQLKPGQWAKHYACCIKCQKTDYKHEGNGLCKLCYSQKFDKKYNYLKNYRQGNYEKLASQKKDWYFKNHNSQILKFKKYREKINFNNNRELILKRDSYTCQMCGATAKLVVHHKDGNGRGVLQKHRNNELSNLITLCRACHAKIHDIKFFKR